MLRPALADAQHLMGLQRQAPARPALAQFNGERRILPRQRAIHGLQKHMLEIQPFICVEVLSVLRDHDLQLVATRDNQLRAHLRAHAHPVDALGHSDGAVGLDRDLEAACVQRVDQGRVELQQRLATRADNERLAALGVGGPFGRDGIG